MFGRSATRASWLLELVLNGCAAYRTQLFCYLKACGREELGTSNLWQGVDAAVPDADFTAAVTSVATDRRTIYTHSDAPSLIFLIFSCGAGREPAANTETRGAYALRHHSGPQCGS